MAAKPIIFAMANPDPEITAEEVAEVRDDAIMATGRSDYPNQVNNVLGFPYIFRGALDVRASTINMEMKIAAARRARRAGARGRARRSRRRSTGARPKYGPDYIIPVPFDPRLISTVPPAVAKAAMDTGVARKPIVDMDAYRHQLNARRDPIAGTLVQVYRAAAPAAQARGVRRGRGRAGDPRRGELRASGAGHGACWSAARTGCARRRTKPASTSARASRSSMPRMSTRNAVYLNHLYERLQRRGYLLRDCQRLVNNDRNHFAACMVALGDADAMVTGVTRNFSVALEDVRRVIDPKPGHRVIGVSLVVARGRTVLVADTAVTEMPEAAEIAEIAIEAAGVARRLGYEPRLALLAFSTFGHPQGERSARVIEAVKILDSKRRRFRI